MINHGLKLTVVVVLFGITILVVSEGRSAPGQKSRSALTRATPKTTSPAATPLAGTAVPARPYGTGAQTPLQLLNRGKPNLLIYFPFDRDVYDRNNPAVPLDIMGHLIYNSGAYMRPGRLRDSERFGPLVAMFIAVPPAPNTISLDMSQYCTIAAWVLPERFGGITGTNSEAILCRGVTTTDNSLSYGLYLSAAGIPVFESRVPPNLPNPGPWARQASRGVAPGQWHHVCVVYEAGIVSFYIDGQSAGQSQAPPPRVLDSVRLAQCPVYIGTRFVNDLTGEIRDPYFGYLDDLALWNRPLKPNEIALLASDADGNGMADFWDLLITGFYPAPASGTTPTSGTAPTPIPPTPTRSPFTIKGAKTPTPSATPAGRVAPRSTPTPGILRTPPGTAPDQTGGVRRGPGSPSATPPPRDRQGPKPTPVAPQPPKVRGPESKPPSAQPPGVQGQPTTPRVVRPTPTPPGDPDNPTPRTPPSGRSVR